MPSSVSISISHMGATALLVQSGGPLSVDVQSRYWAYDQACKALEGVVETVLGMHSLLVYLTPDCDPMRMKVELEQLWQRTKPRQIEGRLVEIPVIYGGETGMDLSELADSCSLSVDEVVALHSEPDYVAFALGSQPGFAYLGGMNSRLTTPRRAQPRLSVQEGSVVIGGAQAGVIAKTSPSGWHVIGKTELSFFDETKQSPSLIMPGDRIRFVVQELIA
ncbi:sensor histidine kinase inhibitor, KipI family [Cohaesibacter marisflavi]|uniref:Sensor histidine kinase inhibitor, KipI family n=1 Tax=Cohaesibacter marisflavi TaxID=655353 RepID=A0A1I5EZX4_9HYPH|nr:5-oxoprolinase subunit PxpB [Cohaesibacter marisflavi]SFO16940.1 sensor histidine kinase inhibitor, KipI family [Cohaesibacter marisflavi]